MARRHRRDVRERSGSVKSGPVTETGMAERNGQLEALAATRPRSWVAPATAETVVEALDRGGASSPRSVATAEQEAAAARGKSELIRAAISDLGGADAVCPTCLRPLSEHDAEAGRSRAHEASQGAGQRRSRRPTKRSRANGAGRYSSAHELLSRRARSRSHGTRDGDRRDRRSTPRARRSSGRRRSCRRSTRHSRCSRRKGRAAECARDRDEEEERIRELEMLYRARGDRACDARGPRRNRQRDHRAIHRAARERGRESLEVDVRHRRSELSARKDTSRDRLGGRTLGFGSLSAGARRCGRLLLTRLLIAGASTQAPFIWLDEPLEHLDPKLRKVVAGTLAKASSGAGLRQVIVTTYESRTRTPADGGRPLGVASLRHDLG